MEKTADISCDIFAAAMPTQKTALAGVDNLAPIEYNL
jgi:hypothetical protein